MFTFRCKVSISYIYQHMAHRRLGANALMKPLANLTVCIDSHIYYSHWKKNKNKNKNKNLISTIIKHLASKQCPYMFWQPYTLSTSKGKKKSISWTIIRQWRGSEIAKQQKGNIKHMLGIKKLCVYIYIYIINK